MNISIPSTGFVVNTNACYWMSLTCRADNRHEAFPHTVTITMHWKVTTATAVVLIFPSVSNET